MQLRVKLYGLLTAGRDDPDAGIPLNLPDGTDVAGVIETLGEASPLFDPRSILAVVDGAKVPLDHVLHDGDELHLYHLFSGG